VNAFHGITRQTWQIGWRSRTTEAARATMLDTHMAIAEAVAAGDPVEAARLMGLHFDESVRALIDAGLA
jgi:DNA-binding FadR family transcriptional regulator